MPQMYDFKHADLVLECGCVGYDNDYTCYFFSKGFVLTLHSESILESTIIFDTEKSLLEDAVESVKEHEFRVLDGEIPGWIQCGECNKWIEEKDAEFSDDHNQVCQPCRDYEYRMSLREAR